MFKTKIIVGFCQVLSLSAIGQDTFSVSKGVYNDAGTVVAPTQMNVFYIGIDNPVDIAVPGVLNKEVIATITGGGSIKKMSDGQYVVNVTSVGVCTIAVLVKGQEVSRTAFRVKRIPEPVARINGMLVSNEIYTNLFRAQKGILVVLDNFDFDAHFVVKSFSMIIINKEGLQSIQTEGPLFNTQMKAAIANSKQGDRICFDNIIIISPDGQPRKISGFCVLLI